MMRVFHVRGAQVPRLLILLALAAAPSFARAADEPPRSEIQTSATIPEGQDACLDHSARELGMSAKRQGSARLWNIAPQFIHPSLVPQGAVSLGFEKAAAATLARVTVTWPGAPKPREVQAEIESRLRAMTEKIAQLCGAAGTAVTCQSTPAGGKPAACGAP